MEYRRMSEEMSSQEVHLLMKVLIPEAEVKSYDRCRDTNCIDVTYCLYGQERVITFYEDDIENALDDVEMEGEKYYRIYMIANGYSCLWKTESQMELGEWFMKAGRDIEECLKRQEEKDKELQVLQKRADTILEEVLEDADAEAVRDKLLEFQKLELQVRERMKHTGYVLGASDAAKMIHKTEGAIEVLDLVTELEILVREYRDIQSLLLVFGDGIKESLGEYDVTKGVYAIAKAMEARNAAFQDLFGKIVGE